MQLVLLKLRSKKEKKWFFSFKFKTKFFIHSILKSFFFLNYTKALWGRIEEEVGGGGGGGRRKIKQNLKFGAKLRVNKCHLSVYIILYNFCFLFKFVFRKFCAQTINEYMADTFLLLTCFSFQLFCLPLFLK